MLIFHLKGRFEALHNCFCNMVEIWTRRDWTTLMVAHSLASKLRAISQNESRMAAGTQTGAVPRQLNVWIWRCLAWVWGISKTAKAASPADPDHSSTTGYWFSPCNDKSYWSGGSGRDVLPYLWLLRTSSAVIVHATFEAHMNTQSKMF